MRLPWSKKEARQSASTGQLDKGLTIIRDESVNPATLAFPVLDDVSIERNSAVQACINWAARAIVEPTLCAYRQEGSTWVKIDHPALKIIYPDTHSTVIPSFERILQGTIGSLIRSGNAYLPIEKEMLTYQHENNVMIDSSTGTIEYRVGTRKIDQMVHIRFGVDPLEPWKGMSPIQSLARHVSADNYAARYMESVSRTPYASTVFTPAAPEYMTQELADKIKEKFAQLSGGENQGGMVILSLPGELKEIGLTPEKMGLSSFTRLSEERVCAVLGIPAVVVGLGAGLERSTFTNMNMAWNHALRNFMVPMWDLIAKSLTDQLVSEPGIKLAFALDEVYALQEDLDMRHERVRKDYTSGIIPLSRAKELVGEIASPGDEDTYYAQPNVPI